MVMLQNRFKEFRREKKSGSGSKLPTPAIPKPKPKPKSPAKQLMTRPEIAAGEDKASYSRFCSKISEEFMRKKPRPEVYQSLISLTYPHRRREMLDTLRRVTDVLQQHPFLRQEDQVCVL